MTAVRTVPPTHRDRTAADTDAPAGNPPGRPARRVPLRPRLPDWTGTLYARFALTIAVCCLVATVLSLLAHRAVTEEPLDYARQKALSRLDSAEREYVEGGELGPDAAVDPPELPPALRAGALRGERGTTLADHRGRATVWAASSRDGRVLAVRVDYSAAERSLERVDWAIAGSAAFVVGVTVLAGLAMTARISRRLRRTAQVARRISAGDLDARVGSEDRSDRRGDEVAAVAAALDSMASALQSRIRNEQRFTADVAHELRTPLTGLHAAAELLPPGRPTELVRDRVQALRRLTEDLLEISRLDAQVERANPGVHQLGPLVEAAVAATGLAAEVTVVDDVVVETDRRRLDRVIGNLVANAHQHGCPPVVLTVDGPTITVRDHGDGYPDELLDYGPRRFRTESTSSGKKGHGLGLTIAVGQARVLEADLRFANAPDGGALTTLTLPERRAVT
ncbi:ATPase [Wenjunlia vitaminophila]|uniref:histidine kinase n=1 Tax=Wenjunlia vitaminophila TaxID=76728 RepID=A0A0T6LQX0_WENVI|nr:HAMP domain-containing sensor histidine kinase [Wenjunlia vitaminophila]KRV48448.1 ATPase [Wenjunlia vitaminophila]